MEMKMGRKSKKIKQKPIIGIFCEGKSEKQYLTMLKQKYRSTNVKIEIVDAGLSGKKLVEKAIKSRKHKKFDAVYVVFDRDDHKKEELRACSKLAKTNNVNIIFSSIDFEIWILMHFEPVFRRYTRPELVTRLSKEKYFNQDYSRFKGNSYRSYIFDKVENTMNNATKLYKKNSNWIEDDPFTNIHIYLPRIFDIK